MSSGNEFYTTGPETRKILGPKRRVLVWGTVRSPLTTADRRRVLALTSQTGIQVQLRYVEPRPWRMLWMMTAILKLIRWRMEASGVDSSAQEWCGQIFFCSRSAWLPRYGLHTCNNQQMLWFLKKVTLLKHLIERSYLDERRIRSAGKFWLLVILTRSPTPTSVHFIVRQSPSRKTETQLKQLIT